MTVFSLASEGSADGTRAELHELFVDGRARPRFQHRRGGLSHLLFHAGARRGRRAPRVSAHFLQVQS